MVSGCQGNKFLERMLASGVKLTLSDHLGDLVTGQRCRCSAERFEHIHLSGQTLDDAFLLFDRVVRTRTMTCRTSLFRC